MATNSFYQVPPDSTGKKLHAQQHTIDGGAQLIQTYHLADNVNPSHIQSVDARGQASVRFAEGSPSMDAFGNLRVSNARVIGAYEYTNGDMGDLFQQHTKNNGSVVYSPTESCIYLSVDNTPGSTSGRITNRYHYYQPGVGNLVIITLALSDTGKVGNKRGWGYGDHQNGLFWALQGQTLGVVMSSSVGTAVNTTATGTQGQYTITVASAAGLSVGMYPIAEGINAFSSITEINGNVITLDYANVGAVSGAISFSHIVNTFKPRAEWNGDKLDGTGISGMTIDLTKANFYWIDYAWLGVGPVRFGVLGPDGSRITCHTFENPNAHLGAYMASGSMPIHFHNENTAETSGSCHIKQICSAVYAESDVDYTFWRFSDIEVAPKPVTSNTPVVSVKPKIISNDKFNRVGMYPCSLQVVVTGSTDAMVSIQIVDDGTLTDASWSGTSEGSCIYDDDATAITDGSKFKTYYYGYGCHNICLEGVYETNDEGYHVLADASGSHVFNVVATKLNGTTANVGVNLCYRELR